MFWWLSGRSGEVYFARAERRKRGNAIRVNSCNSCKKPSTRISPIHTNRRILLVSPKSEELGDRCVADDHGNPIPVRGSRRRYCVPGSSQGVRVLQLRGDAAVAPGERGNINGADQCGGDLQWRRRRGLNERPQNGVGSRGGRGNWISVARDVGGLAIGPDGVGGPGRLEQ